MLWGREVCPSLKNRDSGGPSTPGEMSHTLIPSFPEQEVLGSRGIFIHVGTVCTQMWERDKRDCAELCWFLYAQILP